MIFGFERYAMVRRGWISLLALGSSLALAGCIILDNSLSMNELTEGDIRIMCDQHEHGVVSCDGGWQAGFASVQECVETFQRFSEDTAYDYYGPDCDAITVGEARGCLNIAPCDRPTSELCEDIYACVKKYRAEDHGIESD